MLTKIICDTCGKEWRMENWGEHCPKCGQIAKENKDVIERLEKYRESIKKYRR